MTNCEKYHDTWCRTCIFAATSDTVTECNLILTCALCDCYNREAQRCHCHDDADDSAACPYYKGNRR